VAERSVRRSGPAGRRLPSGLLAMVRNMSAWSRRPWERATAGPVLQDINCECRSESVAFCRRGKNWHKPCRAVCQRPASKTRSSYGLALSPMSRPSAAAIREIYERDGELSAAVELRRRFPGITDNAIARNHARWIAGWASTPEQPLVASTQRESRAVDGGQHRTPGGCGAY
jgi:hypothetical protein